MIKHRKWVDVIVEIIIETVVKKEHVVTIEPVVSVEVGGIVETVEIEDTAGRLKQDNLDMGLWLNQYNLV
jgi:hypothetical protein